MNNMMNIVSSCFILLSLLFFFSIHDTERAIYFLLLAILFKLEVINEHK